MFILQIGLEIAVAAFIIWGLFNEKKLVEFENRIVDFVKRKVSSSHAKRNVYRHETNHHYNDDRNCA